MRFRFGFQSSAYPLPFSGRYLTRLFLLTGFCVAIMVALAMPGKRRSGPAKGHPPAQSNTPVIQTAIAPSPFGELGIGVIVADDQPKIIPEQGESAVRMPDSPEGDLPPVDQAMLEHVLDKTSDRSKRPFYHLLTLAATASPATLEKHARRNVKYAEIWNEPEKYRGELIYLKGYIRGLQAWQATENEFFNPAKLGTLYDGYLLTDDSRPNPFVIVVPHVAEGMPVGMNISENIVFVGYFFKLWRYQAVDRTERAAPLLVGQIMSWTPAPRSSGIRLGGYLAAAFILLVMTVGSAIWMINRGRTRAAAALPTAGASSDAETLSNLAELEKQDS